MQKWMRAIVLVFGVLTLGVGVDASQDVNSPQDTHISATISGIAHLSDGTPAAGATISVMSYAGSAITQADGSFVLEAGIPSVCAELSITVLLTRDGVHWIGTASGLIVGGDRFVDAGVIVLGSACEPGWVEGEFDFCEVGLNGSVSAVLSWDDGSGEALYVGGEFSIAGCESVSNIARWDGSSWISLGTGLDGIVRTLAAFDDGNGPALYAGGGFTEAGGSPASRIARWDGAAWSSLGEGIAGNSGVYALAVFDDGSGPALYVGGDFWQAGGFSAESFARWDGSEWVSMGVDLGCCYVRAMTVFDDGSGPALYVGGDFTEIGNRIARWDGSSWSVLGVGVGEAPTGEPLIDENTFVSALAVYDDGSGPALYVGGHFTQAGGNTANHIARWDGAVWSTLGVGMNDTVWALTVFDDGSGSALFAGGEFTQAGGNTANRIARWANSPFPWGSASWSPLGAGLGSVLGVFEVSALTIFDDGSGPALYAGGSFPTDASGFPPLPLNNLGRWSGSAWSPVANPNDVGLNGFVYALAVFDDGSGPALYAGGRFNKSEGSPVNLIARWDGETWLPLGEGVSGNIDARVEALAVFDDGSGPSLYAGGRFTDASGNSVSNIARWDGTAWSPLGAGVNSYIYALTVFDDGDGPALYAGGSFTEAGGNPASRIARWDGASWTPLGTGVSNSVFALTVFDDGSRPALYAGGGFFVAGENSASRIARWDGAVWSPLGTGIDLSVLVLRVFDDGNGPALYAGGSFTQAGGSPAGYVAKWQGCPGTPEPCPADVNGDGVVDLNDLNLVLTNFGQETSEGDTNGDGIVDLNDLNAVLTAFGTECE